MSTLTDSEFETFIENLRKFQNTGQLEITGHETKYESVPSPDTFGLRHYKPAWDVFTIQIPIK
jgi:hypothetical protein